MSLFCVIAIIETDGDDLGRSWNRTFQVNAAHRDPVFPIAKRALQKVTSSVHGSMSFSEEMEHVGKLGGIVIISVRQCGQGSDSVAGHNTELRALL